MPGHAAEIAPARFPMADPQESTRHERSLFAGYHAQLARRVEGNLLYRCDFYFDPEGNRRDVNQTVSVALRCQMTDWLSAFGSMY